MHRDGVTRAPITSLHANLPKIICGVANKIKLKVNKITGDVLRGVCCRFWLLYFICVYSKL